MLKFCLSIIITAFIYLQNKPVKEETGFVFLIFMVLLQQK